MSDTEHKEFATSVLTAIGLRIELFPRSDRPSADLLAYDKKSTYFIELKRKLDHVSSDGVATLARGDVHYRSTPTTYHNGISRRLRKGRGQLDESAAAANAFRIIWFHVGGFDHALHLKQAFSTFYGRVHLLPLEPPGPVIACFYFDYSEALSMPSVDAMILTDNLGLQLCLNEFSPRHDAFLLTSVCQHFARGLVDPIARARQGQIVAFHSRLPRKNDEAILRALREQTGVWYIAIRFRQHSASVLAE